jgi:hypothetical protein
VEAFIHLVASDIATREEVTQGDTHLRNLKVVAVIHHQDTSALPLVT